MRQKFFLHIEEGIATFDDANDPKLLRLKNDLNSKGIVARIRMRTPVEK